LKQYDRPFLIGNQSDLKQIVENVLDHAGTIVSRMGGDLDSIIVDYDKFEYLVEKLCYSLEEEYEFNDA